MQIAQGLFNNSHITYMRTDSVRLADETIAQIRKYIDGAFENILPPKARVHKDKGEGVQGAHEAIHPTNMSPSGDPNVMQGLTFEEQNVYKMIFQVFCVWVSFQPSHHTYYTGLSLTSQKNIRKLTCTSEK